MKKDNISKNVIRRLPLYLRCLDELIDENAERISSTELGKRMNLTPSQIRQDFSCFGEFGQQGYGYNVKALRSEIANILGMDRRYSIILVGVGRIGHTLIENFNFARYGFEFKGAFDIDSDVVGTQFAGMAIMNIEEQSKFIRENNIDIAILAVQKTHAQAAADKLVECGIKAIWNFADTHINVNDPTVSVENIYFADSLLALSYRLSANEEK